MRIFKTRLGGRVGEHHQTGKSDPRQISSGPQQRKAQLCDQNHAADSHSENRTADVSPQGVNRRQQRVTSVPEGGASRSSLSG